MRIIAAGQSNKDSIVPIPQEFDVIIAGVQFQGFSPRKDIRKQVFDILVPQLEFRVAEDSQQLCD